MSLSKIKALAERSQQFHARLTGDLDKEMAAYDELEQRKTVALERHAGYRATIAKDLADAETAITQLSNIPLDGSPAEPDKSHS